MSEMRILTVRQPWAWAIIHGGKDVENRVRNIAGDYRGPVAIHVALKDAAGVPYEPMWDAYSEFYLPLVASTPGARFRQDVDGRGAIIGVVDLVDVHELSSYGHHDARTFLDYAGHTEANELCSLWAEHFDYGYGWHLVLHNPRALAAPIQYRGALGLRTLPTDVGQLILGGLA